MKIFLEIVNYLVLFAVGITAVRMYLTVNKLWKRKHEKSVSESISIFAYFLAIMVHLPFMCKFIFIDKMIMPALNDALNIAAYLVIIAIGTGFWVRENKRINLFELLKKALRLERKESGYLLKSLVQPRGAKQIFVILEKVASLDNKISADETKLIKTFAEQWHIEIPDDYDWSKTKETSLIDIRTSMEDYLDISPPADQATELVDLIELVIKADKIITSEEDLFLHEVKKMIDDYVNNNKDAKLYYVLIVPQSAEQWDALKVMFPTCEIESWRGGKVLVMGKFYSKKYAEAICQKYISQGVFTIWDEQKQHSA